MLYTGKLLFFCENNAFLAFLFIFASFGRIMYSDVLSFDECLIVYVKLPVRYFLYHVLEYRIVTIAFRLHDLEQIFFWLINVRVFEDFFSTLLRYAFIDIVLFLWYFESSRNVKLLSLV